jgi:hypothetical protein
MDESTATVTTGGSFDYTPSNSNVVRNRTIDQITFEAYYIYGSWYDYWIS